MSENKSTNKAPKSIKGLNARKSALLLLDKIVRQKQTFDDALLQHKNDDLWQNLSDRDQAFVRNLVMTSVRYFNQLDRISRNYLKKQIPHKAYLTKYIIIMGGAQLLYLETPPHAAISLSLNLADTNDAKHYKKLINAILGNISREKAKLLKKKVSVDHILPKWIGKKWRNYFGEAITKQFAETYLAQPATHLTVKSNTSEWAEKWNATQIGDYTIKLDEKMPIAKMEGFEEGEFWAQDASAAIPATLFSDLKGKDVLDLCAAPGGKTMQLANFGANVDALDINKKRLKRLEENLERTKLSANVICADIRKFETEKQYDAILLDAPCSATGTFRKHPEVLMLKNMDDVRSLAKIQAELIDKALTLLKVGGELIYVTCSIEAEEGEKQISNLLARNKSVEVDPIDPDEIGLIYDTAGLRVSPKGYLRILPNCNDDNGGMDGFFIARLVKTA